MRGLSLEEINELFGDPVAVYITHGDMKDVDMDDMEQKGPQVQERDNVETTAPVELRSNSR